MIMPVEPPPPSNGHNPGLEPRVYPLISPQGQPEHLSASSIKDYLGCSLRFYFRRVAGLPEPTTASLHLGKAVHAGIQAYHQARWRETDASAEAIVQRYREAFARLEQDDGPVAFAPGEREASLEKGETVLRAYLESPHAANQAKPLGVEVRLEETFPEFPIPLLGYVDLVSSGPVPVDFKTCAATPQLDLEVFLHELQLTTYQLLIEAATGEPVKARELVFLVKTRNPKIVAHRIAPASQADYDRFWALAWAVYEGIRQERWMPQPGMHCGWCAFRSECARWTGGKHD